MKEYTEKQKQAKEKFCQDRGAWKWNQTWETILGMNEEMISAYAALSSVPHKKGHLSAKVITLIYVASDASITHLYAPGIKNHIEHGLRDLGITKEEFMETLAIATSVGTGTFTECYPAFMKALSEEGIEVTGNAEKVKKLRERCKTELDRWDSGLEKIAGMDLEMLEAYLDYVKAALSKNILEPKVREFLYIALNAAPTTLNKENVYVHIKKALKLGATKDEIAEIFDLVSCNGIHTITVGVPILSEAAGGLQKK